MNELFLGYFSNFSSFVPVENPDDMSKAPVYILQTPTDVPIGTALLSQPDAVKFVNNEALRFCHELLHDADRYSRPDNFLANPAGVGCARLSQNVLFSETSRFLKLP